MAKEIRFQLDDKQERAGIDKAVKMQKELGRVPSLNELAKIVLLESIK